MAEVDLEKNLALGIGPPGHKFLLPNMWREFLTFTLGEKYGVAWVAKANNKFNIKPDASIRHYKMYNTEEEALNARASTATWRWMASAVSFEEQARAMAGKSRPRLKQPHTAVHRPKISPRVTPGHGELGLNPDSLSSLKHSDNL